MQTFDLGKEGLRALNSSLHALKGQTNMTKWEVVNPKGAHAIAAGVDAEVFAEHRAQHQVRLGEGIGAQHAVDVGQPQAGVGHRAQRRLGMQAQAAAARQLAHRGVEGAGDEGVHRHERPTPLKRSGRLARKPATASSW
mgnify:CR=1 FL=1